MRAKVNGGGNHDFILDTGAERMVISREVARRRGVHPLTHIQTAGVGEVGLRGLEIGRVAELPLRMHRLAIVGGRVNGRHTATFIVDTGGEVISISQSTAGLIQRERRIRLKVYGNDDPAELKAE